VPHGSIWVGQVEIVALCDAVVSLSSPAMESYPDVDERRWREANERHPGLMTSEGHWRLHVHAHVVRSQGRTFLMDTGIGPASAPAFAWTGLEGNLPSELAEVGVDPPDVELVLISHVHDDHLGWNVTGASTPMFPNARYVLHRADWELMAEATDEEDREIFASLLEPLEHAGLVDLLDGSSPLTDELRLEHAPGHTPGHQVLAIDSDGEHAVLSADLVNHPVQLHQHGLASASDMDPERANVTRTSWLERIEREGAVVAPAHFAEPFGRIVRHDADRRWEPLVR
jgi:glyoxylase-like metal-dependent hydrolase (beta-lactamase superfamily II)